MKTKDTVRIAAPLSYAILGLFFVFFDENLKKNRFYMFHVKQSLNFFIFLAAFLLVYDIIGILLDVIMGVPVFGLIIARIMWFVFSAIGIFFLVIWIIGVINACYEKRKNLPLIGFIADKYLKF